MLKIFFGDMSDAVYNTASYFKYDYEDPHEENGRNKVLHGHLHPRFWSKEEFEKLIHDIAEMSQFAGF